MGLGSVLLLLASAHQAAGQHTYAGRNYSDAVSKMLVVNSTAQTNLFNSIIRVNASKGAFGEFSQASQITPQEISNLCKPFPCGNENVNSGSSPSAYPTAVAPTYVPAPPRSFPITATDYRPTGTRILPDDLSRRAPGTAEEKELLRIMSNQFLDAFEKDGRRNNVANGFTFLTALSLEIVTGREPSDLEQEQLISGFNNWLAAMPEFASMSAHNKQVLTESAVIGGGMMALLHEQGKQQKDAKMQADARQMAKATIAYFFGVQLQ